MSSQARSMECLLRPGRGQLRVWEGRRARFGAKFHMCLVARPPWCLLANHANHANQRLSVALAQFRVCDTCLAL